MRTNAEVLFALHHAGPGTTVSEIKSLFPNEPSSVLSTRLCRLRDKGFCTSNLKMGINHWTLTDQGIAKLKAPPAPEPPEDQDLNPDLSAEMSAAASAEPTVPPDETAPTTPEFAVERSAERSAERDDGDHLLPQVQCDPDPIARELLRAMEIEAALDQVCQQLQAASIPAQTERVYRRLLSSLPPVLRDVLAPMTAILPKNWE